MENYKNDKWRLGYHLMPPTGWLNDPNGLCQMNGTYHVFFQYAPGYPADNTKGWGHYTSKNLIDWEYAGMPLLPDQSFDKDGVYSGSAFLEDGKMHLFYTGNVKEPGEHDYILSGRGSATIHVESEDGIQFGEKECVLVNADYPAEYSCHIRDPKVWKENGQYYMVLGGRTRKDQGRVLLYTSKDLKAWTLANELQVNESFGYMWECPDLFQVDGQYLLSVSPQGLPREEYRFQNVYQSGYFKLEGDFAGTCKLTDFKQWDFGFDFYAPQTFEDEKGRRILIGWMGMPDVTEEYIDPTEGWTQCLTMLREVSIKNGKVYQKPVAEYQQLRKTGDPIYDGKAYAMPNSFELDLYNETNDNICVLLSNEVLIQYKAGEKEFSLQFTNNSGAGRTIRKFRTESCKRLQIYVDKSAVELYINDGEYTMATRYYPENSRAKVEIASPAVTGNIWELNPYSIK